MIDEIDNSSAKCSKYHQNTVHVHTSIITPVLIINITATCQQHILVHYVAPYPTILVVVPYRHDAPLHES